ncbi:dihydrolipoamide acetyltransferase family protein [Fluviicola taffensis]|uniref:Dihydrolipoamide acetyltransferase component of pyruvate dehydrogenase complex n=1 Tax=Fluviicola taffensis (strain DSM 16823 / NCIMB 13979 / RW262) TaxID=755732 RepID=F2IFE7_FLUTR|nr:dihydrolipoamide acetyltransferase family protein [Fluviicola taffensis]AEA44632.1 Dihydrolipoyllysine-residue acetyltransferase [Fluviicola taffensis DSM 16823]
MAQIEIRLPKMGESVTEATITNWLKEVGDTVEMDEPLVEVATDKVDNELPSEAAGVLVQKLFEKDQVAQVGDVIAIISTDGDAAPVAPKADNAAVAAVAETVAVAQAVVSNGGVTLEKSSGNGKFISPLVRSIAQQENISMSEIDALSGTGMGGRVTKKDILSYIDTRGTAPAAVAQPPVSVAAPAASNGAAPAVVSGGNSFLSNIKEPVVVPMPGDEIIEMDRMRKLIAEHMVMSKHVSPHVTSFVEADVTNIVMWRNKMKKDFEKREGENLTFTPIFMEAIVKAIKDFPMINVSLSGNQIIKRKDINIGMATALPSGNLIVPVIKNADRLNLTGIAKSVNQLARAARDNKLKPEDIQGGTYTVTNVGTFGNVMGTPIINQPQVAILALGAIRKLPAVIETPEGDFIGIRHKMFLSHSYDHRVVDGSLGGMFVRRVADYLEQFDVNREL